MRRRLFYDVPAEGYRELYGEEQIQKYEAVFREAVKLEDIERIVDIGCGIGMLEQYLRRLGFNGIYVGIDILMDRLREAMKSKSGDSDLILADAHHLPFRKESFDLAALVTVIHLLDVDTILSEVKRVGKRLIIITVMKKMNELARKLLGRITDLSSIKKVLLIDKPWIKDVIYVAFKESI